MGLLRSIGRGIGGIGRKLAMRSRWLAKRLWLVMLAEVAMASRRHWKRLQPDERRRMLELARKSAGRPARNLNRREQRELSALLDKLGHIEYAGSVAGIVLPFRPLSSLAAKVLERRRGNVLAELRAAEAEPPSNGGAAGAAANGPAAGAGAEDRSSAASRQR
jgi:hypothetical protein